MQVVLVTNISILHLLNIASSIQTINVDTNSAVIHKMF